MLRWLQRIFGFSPTGDAGARGERQAEEWLQRERGFAVVARNWRAPRDRRQEIDLVCRDGEVLVFVEVKTRAANALVPGYYAVDRRKKRVMRRAIDAYLARLAPPPRTFRFDVVEVASGGDGAASEILHFENVPLFSKHYRR
jgi:putative endonuclease